MGLLSHTDGQWLANFELARDIPHHRLVSSFLKRRGKIAMGDSERGECEFFGPRSRAPVSKRR